jgi:Protein of unknown function (DUF2845)
MSFAKRWPVSCLALLLVPALSPAAARADLRCGSKLVSVGASAYDLSSTCGAPDFTTSHVERRTVRRARSVPCASGVCTVMVEESVEVTVDEWVYDFGRNRFVQHVLLEQGVITSIRSGSYGKKV